MAENKEKKELFTCSAWAAKERKNPNLVRAMMAHCEADGFYGRFKTYYDETFRRLEREQHHARAFDPEPDLEEADLELKKQKIESLKIDNMERKRDLVMRVTMEDFITFLTSTFAENLRHATKDQPDEYYNLLVETIYKSIEKYVRKNKLSDIILTEKREEIKEILEEEPFDMEERDFIIEI